ncbi:MAG: hypothetical protein ACLP50_25525, partial [Solirubrobacteraceae bacterium]
TCDAYLRRVPATRTCDAYLRRVPATRTCDAYLRRVSATRAESHRIGYLTCPLREATCGLELALDGERAR